MTSPRDDEPVPPAGSRLLPFFVYGTLRPGGRNHSWALRGRTTAEVPARMPGAVLYEGPGFPYAVTEPENAAAEIHGHLIRPLPSRYRSVLADLDRLEGYVPGADGNHYERRAAVVRTESGEPVRAWVYVAAAPLSARLRAAARSIPGGSWPARATPHPAEEP
ncbi:gamma-glutamylcyclotransferase [Streptomyces sp. ACA25]|uniref:gamma-glutamylcyclotransferase family protein n=1 Tax=Streptomyces sp. ACA25 TaxID=3022596 RepID=UPI0023075305|nr:gamma-glutamylcyclotransferase family protein [Streptomyces sp. ACA25]MDB1089180.1 gamma-glutamylcyclotransferase [Streptomyces sp. ACA25]